MTLPKLGRRATLSTACSRSSVTAKGLESVMEAIIARMPGVASGIPGGAPGPNAAAAAAQMSPTETAAAAAEAAQAAMANYQDVAALQVSVRALALGMQQQGCEQTCTPPPKVSRARARAPSSAKVSNKGRLPDSVTSILLDWFMANVLHPFPNSKQKDSLMSQTGLSRIQLKNWLTNLRYLQLVSYNVLVQTNACASLLALVAVQQAPLDAGVQEGASCSLPLGTAAG